jgi:hypothetical protein
MRRDAIIRRCPLLLAAVLCSAAPLGASGADFWLSTKGDVTPGPERVVASINPGTPLRLYVWGRPTAGRVLRSVSLNLVASAPGLDLVDGSFSFRNDAGAGRERFEHVLDSTTVPTLFSDQSALAAAATADSVLGINGFTLFPTSIIVGTPPACLSAETGCYAGAGQVARPLFEFDVVGVTPLAASNLFLQVGDLGVIEYDLADGDYDFNGVVDLLDHAAWASGYGVSGVAASDGSADGAVNAADYTVWRDNLDAEGVLLSAADVGVRLGVDALGGIEPLYSASIDRSVTLAGDDADAVLSVLAGPATGVPEPSSAALAGLAAAVARVRRRAS